jgi:hypothetical protein
MDWVSWGTGEKFDDPNFSYFGLVEDSNGFRSDPIIFIPWSHSIKLIGPVQPVSGGRY